MFVGVGVGVGLGVGVFVGVGVGVGLGAGVFAGMGVRVAMNVAVGPPVGLGVAIGRGSILDVAVAVDVVTSGGDCGSPHAESKVAAMEHKSIAPASQDLLDADWLVCLVTGPKRPPVSGGGSAAANIAHRNRQH